MLSIGKLAIGQERYYLETVAAGLEDYYVGSGEEQGRWLGRVAGGFALEGVVDGDVLRCVLEGRHPMTGDPLVRTRPDRIAGWDLTFSAPKSVSVLYAVGSAETVAAVRAAHDAAVDAALEWLDTTGCWSRRGHNGVEAVKGLGFVAAGFAHRSSRAGDPQLHTHVLVPNLVRCDDGMWRAIDARPIYRLAQTAGYLYQAHLRDQLTAALGVEWSAVRKGSAEILGVPPPALREFSTRRQEIRADLTERGLSGPDAARVATLGTRRRKHRDVDAVALRDRWRQRLATLGVTARGLERAVLRRHAPTEVTLGDQAAIMEHLLGADGLTRQRSTFSRAEVVRAWCEHLPSGASIATLEQLATATLRDTRVMQLSGGMTARYSTADLVALERRLVERALTQQHARFARVDPETLEKVLTARRSLTSEQIALVRRVTTSGAGVEIVVAAAGTGKSYSLDAAADAWQRSGYTVIGAALAARAAAELEAHTDVPSDTIAKRLQQLAEGALPCGREVVWLIDEAAMVGTRQLAVLLDHAASTQTKVVLVGDPHQLNAIEAGGVLRGLADRVPCAALTQNRRQEEPWERVALSDLRDGRAVDALQAYVARERITTAPTAMDLRTRIVDDWYQRVGRGDTVLMLATTNQDVDDLNARARALLRADGWVHGRIIEIAGRAFQAGDRVVLTRNDRRLDVRNGTLATVTYVAGTRDEIGVMTDDGHERTLPRSYLDAGGVRHGYALTIHKAQGATVDRCLILGSDNIDQQAGYTALSRGRRENRLYVVSRPEPDLEAHVRTPPEPAWQERLTQQLTRDRTDTLAIDTRDVHRPRQPARDLELGL